MLLNPDFLIGDKKPMNLKALLIILLLTVTGLSAKTIKGKVISVWDGDTINVRSGAQTLKIRLDGIDCPELDQAYGRKARQYTSSLVLGTTVKVILRQKDQYKRWLGEVLTPGGISVNQALLQNGLAWQYLHNKEAKLTRLQNKARAAKLGLWADSKPIPPWTFRKLKRK